MRLVSNDAEFYCASFGKDENFLLRSLGNDMDYHCDVEFDGRFDGDRGGLRTQVYGPHAI